VRYPPLVSYADRDSYREHYERDYCSRPVRTFDGILVRFNKKRFWHAFFESERRGGPKTVFCAERASRIDWIGAALCDPDAELYVGWDSTKKRYDSGRRVAVVVEDYVVIIALTGEAKADFITAFIADSPQTIARIRSSPRWSRK